MANQFDAEIVYRRTEALATHARTGAVCVVRDCSVPRRHPPPDPHRPWFWKIAHRGGTEEGWAATEHAARAAILRRVKKLPDRVRP